MHVIDRFVQAVNETGIDAVNENWPEGEFHASPEIARLFAWHAIHHNWKASDLLFGRKIIADASMVKGLVKFVET